MLCSSKFTCKVTAHQFGEEEDAATKETQAHQQETEGKTGSDLATIYVIKFTKEVTAREK